MHTTLRFWSVVLALATLAAPVAAVAQEAQPDDLVNALNGVFGKHAGKRAAHAKGICVKGSFTPTSEAAALSQPWADVVLSGAVTEDQLGENVAAQEVGAVTQGLEALAVTPVEYWSRRRHLEWR